MECPTCSKESEISEIHTIVKRLDQKLDGDNGLFEKVARFEGAMKVLYLVASLGGISSIVAIIRTFT